MTEFERRVLEYLEWRKADFRSSDRKLRLLYVLVVLYGVFLVLGELVFKF